MFRLSPLVRRSSHCYRQCSSGLAVLQQNGKNHLPALGCAAAVATTNTSIRYQSHNTAKQEKKQKKKKPHASGSAGRIVLQQNAHDGRHKKSSGQPKMCVGCGTEVVITRGGMPQSTGTTIAGGVDAIDLSQTSQTKSKKARYVDTMDSAAQGYLCARCKALQSNNIWKAYDALRDVSPKVFIEQLKHIVARRKFGLCVLVVDATDPEHSTIKNLRQAIGKTPVILVINKIDLVPRMNHFDMSSLVRRLQRNSIRFIDSYAVSAQTGFGFIDLAQGILEKLGGRDVFVVGAANVGKSSLVKRLSTLIADSVRLKGPNRAAAKRRQATADLKVTGSNLPGTTLQAVRVPCFPSRNHALWDTPGIINSRALQYHVFPSHLMEPLTRPSAIEIPTRENGLVHVLRPGESILIEATWMDDNDEADDEESNHHASLKGSSSEPCVLARVDLLETSPSSVYTQAYLHPSLRIRVVPTLHAPPKATIPSSHIDNVKQKIRKATGHSETGLADSYSKTLLPFRSKERPLGEIIPGPDEFAHEKYRMDIVFASLGWISFMDERKFTLVPQCVEGSVFSKRRALYPVNMNAWLEHNHDEMSFEPEEELDGETMRRIRDAAQEGRHLANVRKREAYDYDDDDEWY